MVYYMAIQREGAAKCHKLVSPLIVHKFLWLLSKQKAKTQLQAGKVQRRTKNLAPWRRDRPDICLPGYLKTCNQKCDMH